MCVCVCLWKHLSSFFHCKPPEKASASGQFTASTVAHPGIFKVMVTRCQSDLFQTSVVISGSCPAAPLALKDIQLKDIS